MLARCEAVAKVLLFLLFLWLVPKNLAAQTGINDIHIVPRAPGVGGSNSIQSVDDSMLHTIRTEAKLVLVPVSVTDSMERVVTGLQKDNFEIFEDKRPQTIRHFSSEDVPTSIGIILDSSGSMADKVDRVRDAVNQFCNAANPQDEFFLITFADEPRLASDFTTNPEEIKKELVFARPKGRTALLDAIHMGLRKMKQARYGRKALLIISDGGDNHSRYDERAIKSLAKESDVIIYSIGTFDRSVPTVEELLGPTLLQEIAEPSGGRAFIVDNVSDLPIIAHRIGTDLRTQYVLAYRPQSPKQDGKWRRIRVKLRLPRNLPFLRARARSGYYPSE